MTATIHEPPAQVKQAPAAIAVSGLVDLADGHAFVRTAGYRRGPDDIYVSAAQIRQYGLRKGDLIEGTARPQPASPARGKFRPLLAVDTVNSRPLSAKRVSCTDGPGSRSTRGTLTRAAASDCMMLSTSQS